LAALDGVPVALTDEDVAREEFPGLVAAHDLVIAHRLAHDPDWPRERMVVTPLFVEPLDVALPAAHPWHPPSGSIPWPSADRRGSRRTRAFRSPACCRRSPR
jgi:DNA-binding transcriptional LysR family regulator